MSSEYVAGASAAIKNRTKELVDVFDVDVDLSGTPKEAFQQALAAVVEQHRAVLEEVARRAFRLGAKRGAIQALDAVIEGQIEVDAGDAGPVLTTERKALRVPARRLTIPAGPAGSVEIPIEPFSIAREKLGFE